MYVYFTTTRGTLLIMKIGVFDSGIGGKTIADALELVFPEDEIIYRNDHEHVPYGSRTAKEIEQLTLNAVMPLVETGCGIIVIACNTATTNAIEALRSTYPEVFFVGLEPMIKPAARLSKTKVISICATPATLQSAGYERLKETWAHGMHVIEPDCSAWATLIEHGRAEEIPVKEVVEQLTAAQCDVIVLACTHYHWLKNRFAAAASGITILEPTDAIAERVAHLKQDYNAFTAAIN
jgi:glutamate racemase